MYEQIAHYYDLTHDTLQIDIPFVRQLAEQADGRVLELGCGSGRLLLPLAAQGCAVTGVDNSSAMLSIARRKIAALPPANRRRIQLLQADMSTFQTDDQFALILIPYNTFMHLDTQQAQFTLKRARKLLQPNGRLFIDLLNPMRIAETPNDHLLTLESSVIDPQSGDIILQLAANELDADAQQLHITWIYDRSPATGGPIQRTVARTIYHYRYPHQMELLLRDSGFLKIKICGDYDQSPYHADSERLIFLTHHNDR